MSLQKLAEQVRTKGRNGDTELVHMTRGEVDGLHGLARAMYGRDLPVNPETGLHEASWLKKLLPTLAGAAASYFGGPIWGAVAGGLTGAATNKERGLGALSGAASGWAAGQGLAGLQSAGASARGMTPGSPGEMSLGSLWEGAKALGTEEGRNAFVGSASQAATDKTPFKPSVGIGGNPMQVAGALAAPIMMVDPTESQGQGQGGGRTPIKLKHTSGEWYVDKNGVNRFRYLAASGGEVPEYAKGGASGRNAGTSTSGQTGASKDMLEYLFGRKDLERIAAPAAKLERVRKPELPTSGGGGGQLTQSGPDSVLSGVAPPAVGTGPSGSVGEVGTGFDGTGGDRGAGGYEHGGGTFDSPDDVDIRGGNGMGFAGSEWKDPDGASYYDQQGTMDKILTSPFVDAQDQLGEYGTTFAEYGNKILQFEEENPGVAGAAEWAAKALGLPGLLASQLADEAKRLANIDPNARYGKSYENQLDRESDAAHQAAADAQEMDRLVNRSGSMDPVSTAGDYRNGMDQESDASSAGIGSLGDSGLGDDIAPVTPWDALAEPEPESSGGGGGGGGSWGSTGGWSGGEGFTGIGVDSSWMLHPTGSGSVNKFKRYDIHEAAAGGVVPLQSGGFVFPADVVSALGAGSSSAGLEALAKRFGATPVQGKGHGQSDDIEATIDGKQPARVARDEAVLSAEQVTAIGGGDPKKGAKKLYAMMARVRKQATGSKKQMRVIDANKELA